MFPKTITCNEKDYFITLNHTTLAKTEIVVNGIVTNTIIDVEKLNSGEYSLNKVKDFILKSIAHYISTRKNLKDLEEWHGKITIKIEKNRVLYV